MIGETFPTKTTNYKQRFSMYNLMLDNKKKTMGAKKASTILSSIGVTLHLFFMPTYFATTYEEAQVGEIVTEVRGLRGLGLGVQAWV